MYQITRQPRSQDFFPFLNLKKGKSPGNEVDNEGVWGSCGSCYITASSAVFLGYVLMRSIS